MTTDPIDVEPHEAPLPVPVIAGLITAAPVADVQAIQAQYHELCNSLLDETDYQTIGSRQFRKKSGWRKLAVAFNVSTELKTETEIRGHRNRIEEVKCVVRATAPNGRYMDGMGVASIYERCCDPETCKRWETTRDGAPTGHVHCGDTCNGRHHFSNPAHDIPSTAMTRATNRALADLFGMGEVSAEEMNDNGSQWTPGETAGGSDSRPTSRRRSAPAEPQAPRPAVPAQIDRIAKLREEIGDGADDLFAPGFNAEELLFPQARILIDTLEARKKEIEHDDPE
jgi:hypothetical protein